MIERKMLLHQLETCLKNLGITVRYDKGKFNSGLCVVHGKKVLVLRKNLSEKEYLHIMGTTLLSEDLDNIYIIPAVREFLHSLKEG